MDCVSCNLPVDANALKCNGLCGGSFHISCLSSKNNNYKNALIGYVNKIPNLRWFCDSCSSHIYITTELSKRLAGIKSFAESFLTTLTPSDMTTQKIESTKPAQSNEQKNQDAVNLNGSFSTAISDSEVMDHQSESPPKSQLSLGLNEGATASSLHSKVSSRKRILLASPGVSQRQKQPKLDDKQPVPLADMVAKRTTGKATVEKIVVKTNMMRSVYISPFLPSTEPSDIIGHLELNGDLKHIIPNIKCTKLKRKNQRVKFVSFKLDVPRHHYDILVNPAIWQFDGKDVLTIGEFIDKRASHGRSSAVDEFNPFKPSTKSKGKNDRPSNMTNRNGTNRRQIAPAPKRMGMHQQQRPNFQHRCQKLCCNQPRPQCFNCHDRYGENRFGHRPRNRN